MPMGCLGRDQGDQLEVARYRARAAPAHGGLHIGQHRHLATELPLGFRAID